MTPTPTRDSAVSPVREVFAVLMNGNWSIATKALAGSYSLEPSDADVWCEQGTTALIGLVGKEDASIALSRRSLDTADGVEPDAAWKQVYRKLAEEGGGTWATYMMIEIDALASRTPNTETVVKARHADDCPWYKTRLTLTRHCTCGVERGEAEPVGYVSSTTMAYLTGHVAHVACSIYAEPASIHTIPLYASQPSPAESSMALVPRIETDAMCEAGLEALRENLGHSSVIMRDAAACYRAMVSVASPLQLGKKG
jgi:hypothetical protein